MAQIDIDKFVISLMRYFGNNKGIVTTLDRCLFSLGLKYVDTPMGGRLERVDHPTMLEKIMWESGEQKPTEVEPKFKVGDWIIFNGLLLRIDEIVDGYYRTTTIGGIPNSYDWDIDNVARLWTIQDARDGDVLYMDNGVSTCTFIYKSTNSIIIQKYASYNRFGFEGTTYLVLNDGYVCPATKKQRDTLMKAMADAGYTFDFEKKELKKIEQKPVECSEDNLPDFESYLCLMFQKFRTKGICTNGEIIDFVKEHSQKLKNTLCSAWSEEDEDNLTDIFVAIDNFHTTNHKKELITFLKSIKERVNWKPSKEQMVVLNDIIINGHLSNANERILKGLQEQLKKLREG